MPPWACASRSSPRASATPSTTCSRNTAPGWSRRGCSISTWWRRTGRPACSRQSILKQTPVPWPVFDQVRAGSQGTRRQGTPGSAGAADRRTAGTAGQDSSAASQDSRALGYRCRAAPGDRAGTTGNRRAGAPAHTPRRVGLRGGSGRSAIGKLQRPRHHIIDAYADIDHAKCR